MIDTVKRLVIGRPIETEQQHHQRLSKRIPLAVFSSDALSSTAYASESILGILVLAWQAGLSRWPTMSCFLR